ncbi:MAG: hypothetical protein GX559_01125 [Candidatus Pacebacteria bacterium]|nr:hypothetical protein [Candidatus Paceibacterota bacterium]
MPTETRLLYILSDLAYIAKLNPTKKAHEFVISDFHQLNGQFLDENSLIEKNIKKLVDKLEPGTYQLILPDFLFTNTMVNVKVKTEEEVKDYLNDHLLVDLKIDKEDFYLHTTVLSNYGGSFKVQLTALEKGIVLPLVKALKNNKDLKITAIAPLSFSVKSLVSLEPSVSILQINRELYLAQHYIGVDQCFNTSIDHANDFADTVKTLKGVEPSIQTLYLLSDALVDQKIKEALSDTLPVQQLAEPTPEGEKIPSYIKKIIEAGAKTFSIPDYLLPQFEIDKNYDKELDTKQLEEADAEDETSAAAISKPAVIGEENIVQESDDQASESSEETDAEKEPGEQEPAVDAVLPKDLESETLPAPKKLDLQEINQVETQKDLGQETKPEPEAKELNQEIKEETQKESPKNVKNKQEASGSTAGEIDLAQFANLAIDPSVLNKKDAQKFNKEPSMSDSKPVIKNTTTEGKSVLKMIGIAFFSLVLTAAIGIGLGYGILQLTNKQPADVKPSDETSNPIEEVTPTPEPEKVTINKEDYKLLVVNATTKAGYAGEIANALEEAGFPDVAAKNARGKYEEGNYLLFSDLNEATEATHQALLKEVSELTKLDWELSDKIAGEDSEGAFQAVLVLAK